MPRRRALPRPQRGPTDRIPPSQKGSAPPPPPLLPRACSPVPGAPWAINIPCFLCGLGSLQAALPAPGPCCSRAEGMSPSQPCREGTKQMLLGSYSSVRLELLQALALHRSVNARAENGPAKPFLWPAPHSCSSVPAPERAELALAPGLAARPRGPEAGFGHNRDPASPS